MKSISVPVGASVAPNSFSASTRKPGGCQQQQRSQKRELGLSIVRATSWFSPSSLPSGARPNGWGCCANRTWRARSAGPAPTTAAAVWGPQEGELYELLARALCRAPAAGATTQMSVCCIVRLLFCYNYSNPRLRHPRGPPKSILQPAGQPVARGARPRLPQLVRRRARAAGCCFLMADCREEDEVEEEEEGEG